MNAAEKIRSESQLTKSITISIRTSPFDKYRKYYSNSITVDLPIATSNSIELIKSAIEGLNQIYKYGYFYQKSGVTLSKLQDNSHNELNLLTPLMDNKSKDLMKAIDFTNSKYGRSAVSIAQAGIDNTWRMRKDHSSYIDTARFESLPVIKA